MTMQRRAFLLSLGSFALAGASLGAARAALADGPRDLPPLRAEGPPPPPPGPRYIWRPGHWRWTGRVYAWEPGRYLFRRHGWNRFVPGAWRQRPRGWIWVPAHWE